MKNKINNLEIYEIIKNEALEVIKTEPELNDYINDNILQHISFKEILIYVLAKKIACEKINFEKWKNIFNEIYLVEKDGIELINIAIYDLLTFREKDPASYSLLNVLTNFKGYKSIQIYRISNRLWETGKKNLALILQSKCSETYGVDIHPGAKIGYGIMIDHATGVVIGETAKIGNNCVIYHGVTLGGIGNNNLDRHPKINDNVIIGCNSSILGNIKISNGCKIGAGTIVTKTIDLENVTIIGPSGRIIKND